MSTPSEPLFFQYFSEIWKLVPPTPSFANWGGTEGWQPQILYRAIEGQIASLKILVDTKAGAIYRGNPANAGVTQLVECNLAKVDVASSSLVTRSPFLTLNGLGLKWQRKKARVITGSAKTTNVDQRSRMSKCGREAEKSRHGHERFSCLPGDHRLAWARCEELGHGLSLPGMRLMGESWTSRFSNRLIP